MSVSLEDIPKKLAKAIVKYRAENPDFGTPEGAYDMCLEASADFGGLLEEMGLISEDGREKDWDVVCVPTCNGKQLPYECVLHWVFRYKDLLIDFTARQFNPRYRFPEIWRGPYSSERRELDGWVR